MTTAKLEENKKQHVDLVIFPKKDNDMVAEADIRELIENSEYKDLSIETANIKMLLPK